MLLRALAVLALLSAPAFAEQPVVIELFTSQGCSSCPPADELLAKLHRSQSVKGVEIIALSEHVDYWNNLGWVDPFSSPQFSKRQNWYSKNWPTRLYTPQLVVDGALEVVGNDPAGVTSRIKAARRPTRRRSRSPRPLPRAPESTWPSKSPTCPRTTARSSRSSRRCSRMIFPLTSGAEKTPAAS